MKFIIIIKQYTAFTNLGAAYIAYFTGRKLTLLIMINRIYMYIQV